MTIIHNAFRTPFCVYGHFIGARCIYVGSGTIARAFSLDRELIWLKRTKGEEVSVCILSFHDFRVEALAKERELIETMKPECNVKGGAPDNVQKMKVRCIETGEEFATSAQAAKKLGVSVAAVSHILNGLYRKTKGYSFERVVD